MAAFKETLNATGQSAGMINKPITDTSTVLTLITPASNAVSFTVLGTIDGTNYEPVAVIDQKTRNLIAGGTTITPGTATNGSWKIPDGVNYTGYAVNVSSITGSVTFNYNSAAVVGENSPVTSGSTQGNLSLTGTLGVTGLTTLTGGITLNGLTGTNTITLTTGEASAVNISDGTNTGYLLINTSTDSISMTAYPPTVTSAGGTISLTSGAGGATSGAGGAMTLTGGACTAGNGAGGAFTAAAGASQGTNATGAVASVIGGASGAGATGNGGIAKFVGGASLSTNGTGGAVQATGGVGTGTGAGGAVTITGGASGGASGTAGAVTVDAGAATGGTSASVIIGDANALATYINRGPLKALIVGETLTSLSGAQNFTPTAAQLLGGVLACTGQTGAGTVTLPSGTTLSNAMPRTPVVGDSFQLQFACITGQQLTITGATGTTVVGTAAVPSGKNALLNFINTGVNTWNVYVNVST